VKDSKFEWHLLKAQRNLQVHGVSFDEAVTIFDDPLVDIQPDIVHSVDESRFVAVGRSIEGSLLTVVFTERSEVMRLITARFCTPRERRNYESYDPFA
jgi:uncharacterized DUF497 family protein